MFATHYPLLGQLEVLYPKEAVNYHMSFMYNNVRDNLANDDNEENGLHDDATMSDPSAGTDHITFLYQLVQGLAKRSYGLNVARLADVPADIIEAAALKSNELERVISDRSGLLRYVMACCQGEREN